MSENVVVKAQVEFHDEAWNGTMGQVILTNRRFVYAK